jgi:membrane-bound lytic murein transglycosylase D
MKRRWMMMAAVLVVGPAAAQEVNLTQALNAVDWSVFGELDHEQVEALCRELQTRLQGEYVVDVAALRDVATALLPLLEVHEAWQPYAAWLRARLDYLVVAEEWRVTMAPPRLELPVPPTELPPINPSPERERQIWVKQLERRPPDPRSETVVPRLKPIFAAEGVPAELVWLAEVESGFDPSARSPAGAVGLYQLMPETAKWLGLSVWPRDERLDAERNARAAARYLRQLHGQFGDWRLTLAAYNAGPGRVRRLLEREGARSFDEIATKLPAETQMYVPKVEATLWRRERVALTALN